jgi:hypothetical protein
VFKVTPLVPSAPGLRVHNGGGGACLGDRLSRDAICGSAEFALCLTHSTAAAVALSLRRSVWQVRVRRLSGLRVRLLADQADVLRNRG